MLTQHFHSISEIDSEFITGLHELISDHMLTVDDIIEDEKSYPDNFAFLYTLYFMSGRNSPVAISRAILQKNMTITNRWLGPFKKTHQSLLVQWSFPSTGHEAFIGNPLYKAAIWNKLLQKEMEFQKREGFQSTKITASMNDQQYLTNYSNPKKIYSTVGPIKKTAQNFQEFLTLQNIKTVEYFEQLESLVEENGITISGHKDFSGIFFDSKYSEVEIEKLKTKLI